MNNSGGIETVDSRKVVILDGSFGFQANKYVEKSIEGDPLWSAKLLATQPEVVIKVHSDYINAGCDIIETNSYQASIPGFMRYLQLSRSDSYNLIKKSVELAKNAVQQNASNAVGRIRIAGSMGPYGAYLHDGSEYSGKYGDVSVEDIRNYHEPKMAALLEAGVDLLAIETIPSRKEAEILVKLLKKFPEAKAWLSFSCQSDGIHTVYGDNFGETAVDCYNLNSNQLIALGVNCTAPHAVESLLKGIRTRNCQTPLVVYANSGENYDPIQGWDNNCEKLEEFIPSWLDLGVTIIGGCCRVCDNYIGKIKNEVDNWLIEQKQLLASM